MKSFLLATALLSLAASSLSAKENPAPVQKPNIIFILADDLGFGDLSISGNPIIKTPNLDNLARHSILCVNGYAAYPVCMPSRISILTGRYSDRTGARMNTVVSDVKLDQPWLPGLLKSAGYTTAAVGKWHVGTYSPKKMKTIGFDTWAIPEGAWFHYFHFKMNRPGQPIEDMKDHYVTDVLTDEAIKFIDQNRTHPFFLYLAYNAPHFPLEAPDEEIAPFRGRPEVTSGAAVVYAMVQHLDRKIGDLIAFLKQKGLYDNTIIVFTSDNGPEFGTYFGLDEKRWNANLAGQKLQVYEGGIKVPVIISWPDKFGTSPQKYEGVVDGVDWQPTLTAAAGVKAPPVPIDGVNLLPSLLGRSPPPNPTRFWSYNTLRPTMYSNGALRIGDWKVVRPPSPRFIIWGPPADEPLPAKLPPYQLFNVAQDPDEKHDLAAQEPERLKSMIAEFESTYKSVESGPDNVGVSSLPAKKKPAPPKDTK